MVAKANRNKFIPLLFAFSLLASAGMAAATPVTPIYEVTGFGEFGTVVGGPLETDFGGGFYVTGTITSTVYRADEAFELIQGDDSAYIDVDYLTFVYRIDAGGMVNINFLQINLPLELSSEPIVAVGWNSTVSDIDLTLVNTEVEANYQIEFGDDFGGSPDVFNLLPGETIEMFITFQKLDYFQTTALLDGGGLPVGGVEVLGPSPLPEPASIATALTALLGLSSIVVLRLKQKTNYQ